MVLNLESNIVLNFSESFKSKGDIFNILLLILLILLFVVVDLVTPARAIEANWASSSLICLSLSSSCFRYILFWFSSCLSLSSIFFKYILFWFSSLIFSSL